MKKSLFDILENWDFYLAVEIFLQNSKTVKFNRIDKIACSLSLLYKDSTL